MSKDNNNQTTSSGINSITLATLLFVALKLCGVIAWSWWWVLSPLWITAAVAIVFIIIAVIVTR